jgi:hypothetical protein
MAMSESEIMTAVVEESRQAKIALMKGLHHQRKGEHGHAQTWFKVAEAHMNSATTYLRLQLNKME